MSSQKTITNTDVLLSEIITNILPATSKMDILVGFFYFSGFKGIYKELINKKVRILVGMDAEISIVNSAIKVNEVSFRTATKTDTIKQLKDIFNKTETLDNLEGLEAVQIYIDKIIDGSLEIRRTTDPNHTKLYLFSHEGVFSMGGTLPGTVISGSSNLTYSGLSGRFEYNTIDRDPDNYKTAEEMFEDIWNNHSISITNGGDNDDVVKMLKQETWLKLTKPYYCYIRLLSEYFKDEEGVKTPKDLTNDKFNDLEYQVDAIKKGLKILSEHNGVIIADVVGLGKSIIGSTLLGNINKKALIICPPHLIDGWKDYVKDFDLKAEIFSSGAIDKAFLYDIEDIHKADVVLIDEAHKYRNAETIDYGNLHQICQGKKVILLSATPFNNEPDDIFNLIKLFQIPANPTIHTKKGLINDFRDLQNKYLEIRKEQRDPLISDDITLQKVKKLSEEIRQIIGPVIVRRSRVDLQDIDSYRIDLEKQGYEFANVLDPKELNFPLDDIEDLYTETLEQLVDTDSEGFPTHFKGARYKILTYLYNPDKYQEEIEETLGYEYALLEGRQKNMPFFIRRLLVSRFESSIYAFKKTLGSIINSIDNVFNYLNLLDGVPVIKKGGLPNLDDIFDEDLDVGESVDKIKELIELRDGILIPKSDLKPSFIDDLKYDRDFLKNLLKEWENITSDPKLETFVDKIKDIQLENPDRKIIVFSMFADTIEYLKENLTTRVLVVTGKHKTDSLKEEIKLNFDAGVDEVKQKNDYDILLGTDAISEGYNLHRAGVIINYDIPYNPTKVIQRIGRINRINKKVFDDLYVYNYFPSIVGEEHVNTKKISTLKIKMIATVLGVDVKTLSGDEEVSSFYKRAIEEDKTLNEDKSWDSEFLNDFKKAQENDPEILKKIESIPQRTRILRVENKGIKGVLVFAKKKSNLIFYFYNEKTLKAEPLSLVEAFHLFKANITEEPEEVSKGFYNSYEQLKKEIKNPHADGNMNTQQKKAYENTGDIYKETDDNYFKLLQEVIRLGGLPLVYMKKIRKITKTTWKKDAHDIKELISEEYLKGILDISKSFNEETLDLIISEEFNK
ncbi:MAG: helicase-related protein [Candidatus Gracilibacteria bacterium]|nr:helicase-related protein [Candidatus Gracilibacteria bacterium]